MFKGHGQASQIALCLDKMSHQLGTLAHIRAVVQMLTTHSAFDSREKGSNKDLKSFDRDLRRMQKEALKANRGKARMQVLPSILSPDAQDVESCSDSEFDVDDLNILSMELTSSPNDADNLGGSGSDALAGIATDSSASFHLQAHASEQLLSSKAGVAKEVPQSKVILVTEADPHTADFGRIRPAYDSEKTVYPTVDASRACATLKPLSTTSDLALDSPMLCASPHPGEVRHANTIQSHQSLNSDPTVNPVQAPKTKTWSEASRSGSLSSDAPMVDSTQCAQAVEIKAPSSLRHARQPLLARMRFFRRQESA